MKFDDAFAIVVGNEGVLSMDPADKGNWTGGKVGIGVLKGSKYGISAAAYPHLDIASLTLAQVRQIYAADYWSQASCDALPEALRLDVFDFAVNSGPGTAVRALQKACGAHHLDGSVGNETLLALGQYHPDTIRLRVMCLRQQLMTGDSGWGTQGRGWIKRTSRLGLTGTGL